MHKLLYDWLGLSGPNTVGEITIACLVAIAAWRVYHFVFFLLARPTGLIKREDKDFEYDLRRGGLSSKIHLLGALALSGELLFCLTNGTLPSWKHYIALWVAWLLAVIWSLALAAPFKTRARFLKQREP